MSLGYLTFLIARMYALQDDIFNSFRLMNDMNPDDGLQTVNLTAQSFLPNMRLSNTDDKYKIQQEFGIYENVETERYDLNILKNYFSMDIYFDKKNSAKNEYNRTVVPLVYCKEEDFKMLNLSFSESNA